MHPLVLAITGASGAAYAVRLLDVLHRGGHDVHLTISPSAKIVLRQELAVDVDLDAFRVESLLKATFPWDTAAPKSPSSQPTSQQSGRIVYHRYDDYFAPIASGSFLTAGMVVCPCSGSTLSGIAHGTSTNLIQRAADVHLKEHRKLILVPRETPLSIVHLDNMRRACEAGAVVLPASPGWYHGVQSISDLVDFVVARILDQLGIEHRLMHRWGG
jgi:4-hydroxy-3-polyprenylbenzoate decarboxylase